MRGHSNSIHFLVSWFPIPRLKMATLAETCFFLWDFLRPLWHTFGRRQNELKSNKWWWTIPYLRLITSTFQANFDLPICSSTKSGEKFDPNFTKTFWRTSDLASKLHLEFCFQHRSNNCVAKSWFLWFVVWFEFIKVEKKTFFFYFFFLKRARPC